MRNITRRIQALGDKAAQIKQAIESVPPKIVDVREAVLSTAGQLQQLRSELQGAVGGLRADTEDRLVEALKELDAGADTIRRAGYELRGLDLDLGLNRRLTAQVTWLEDVPESVLRSVLASCASQRTLHALLTALLQAGKLADGVELDHLACDGFVVHLGAAPVVRVCWRSAGSVSASVGGVLPLTAAATPPASAAAAPAPVPKAPASAFTSTSFFEPRPIPPSAGHAPAPAATVSAAAGIVPGAAASVQAAPGTVVAEEARSVQGDWKQGALDRFKRMPDLSGRKR